MNFSAGDITVSFEIAPSVFDICQDMPTGYNAYFAVLSTDVIVGLPLSVWVMVLLTRSKKGCTVTDVFGFNLAILEVVIFFLVYSWLFNYFFLKSAILLKVLNYCAGFFWVGRPLFRSCICVERYLAVVHPIVYFKYKALRYRLACVTFIWVFMIPFGVFIAKDADYTTVTVISVPVLAVETFCSLSILRALRQAQPGGKERQEMNLMKRRAFITVLVIQITMMINYFPVIILKILKLFNSSYYSKCVIMPYLLSFTLTGSFVHPLVYLFKPGRLPCFKHSQGSSLKKCKS